uniref:Uncharacterized protein n=1 Tax=Anguilla anguilla TaxID=7936 RepID=A0A0E9UWC2_ANGAN
MSWPHVFGFSPLSLSHFQHGEWEWVTIMGSLTIVKVTDAGMTSEMTVMSMDG